ncbi:MAG: hypothetical protein A2Z86_09340 [Candidatus Glassbacteria bacterium GWA2_58_10]|uniref:DUF5683 domain-containing protein n=1 Tax=Candidatus Glassbacteria bacterium GWA2_58_10 TaxID=1817865 RepID=A0A1F5YE79_9BACT|nr:MAG: hypothetical protein A2Z86_09340 [Candidatus Glassbacteria bacterium GWA2_58_10]
MTTSYFNILHSRRKSRGAPFALSLWLLFAPAAPLGAADNSPAASPAAQAPDSLALPPGFMETTAADTASRDSTVKSPGGALLRSLALPGWGQFYTSHRIRGSLTAVLETAFFYECWLKFRDRNRLSDRLHRLEREMGSDWPVSDPERVALNQRIKSVRQKGGDYLAYGLTTLMLSLVDSYVSAHLYRFDRNFRVMAAPAAVSVALRF